MMRPDKPHIRWPCWRLLRDESGSAGVEMALIAPVLVLLISGILEVGLVIRANFSLIAAVSAAANHTLAIDAHIDDASAGQAAATLATLLSGGDRSGTVTVNNAAMATLAQGVVTITDLPGDFASCYCPSAASGQIAWGSPTQCGETCDDGSPSGRFVAIAAAAAPNASLGLYGFFVNELVRDAAVVRLP